MTIDSADWRDRALCRNRDPELYDCDSPAARRHCQLLLPPPRKESTASIEGVPNNQRQRYAETMCFGCPVKRECAMNARETGDTGIIRGGLWLGQDGSNAQRSLLAVTGGRPSNRKSSGTGGVVNWSIARCKSCGWRLRPSRGLMKDWPNTRQGADSTQCQSCQRAGRRKRKVLTDVPA